ncbi:MAG: phosphate signaling complex protein PhoU [Acidobacteriaceae bacterium]
MPRIHFQQQLVELKDKLLAMAALSQQALDCAVEAYLQHDEGLCQLVRDLETAINTAERDVDQMAYDLLAKEQPMAVDLRFILAVIKINSDLERVGDQSVNIASRAEGLMNLPKVDLPVDIKRMGAWAGRMVRTAIQALLDADVKLAESVLTMDDKMDEMNHAAQKALVQEMEKHPDVSEQALNAIIISRNLERMADHATNIAEDVIFWVRGSDVRHQMSLATD